MHFSLYESEMKTLICDLQGNHILLTDIQIQSSVDYLDIIKIHYVYILVRLFEQYLSSLV
ncbi:hypothetical protein BC833DRAFT_612656 [Globomyces pollinis-pini]|nr:hypothetical protein BC833DRAFT_612792 [Globomyces pollinis-pini]KAI8892097.1 hypothetical protein BC833DRAFT_612656 [Globomyces pollinis-pini]